jgi:hypothetical protein
MEVCISYRLHLWMSYLRVPKTVLSFLKISLFWGYGKADKLYSVAKNQLLPISLYLRSLILFRLCFCSCVLNCSLHHEDVWGMMVQLQTFRTKWRWAGPSCFMAEAGAPSTLCKGDWLGSGVSIDRMISAGNWDLVVVMTELLELCFFLM